MTIDWQPIDELPSEFKDGRDVLIWVGDEANVALWHENRWGNYGPGWKEAGEGFPIDGATYFAEINPPNQGG